MSACLPFRDLRVLLALTIALTVGSAMAGSERAITLETPTGTLFGALMLPDVAAKVPVVLLIAGSGPTDRDGNSFGTPVHPDSLKLLAAALADAGFASVRYDKRGIAASAKAMTTEADLRIETYVDDAASWTARLATDSRFTGIALIGHSEGSLIGMLAARQGGVRAYVSVDGPAHDAADVLRVQLRGKLTPELASRNEAILTALQQGHRVDDIPPELARLYRPTVQPYLISWFRYVPSDVLAGLDIPCLVVQGDNDIQVSTSEAEALHAAQPRSELLLVPGMTHVLKIASPGPAGQQATYLDPTLPLAPDFTRGVISFLSRTMNPAPLAITSKP